MAGDVLRGVLTVLLLQGRERLLLDLLPLDDGVAAGAARGEEQRQRRQSHSRDGQVLPYLPHRDLLMVFLHDA
jgi:hypothetical protein